jgi:hypothetical protein
VSAPSEIVTVVGRAVERAGGDLDDARHLLAEWERLTADEHGRVDRLRYDAAHPCCRCADAVEADDDGLCERCCGLIRRQVRR